MKLMSCVLGLFLVVLVSGCAANKHKTIKATNADVNASMIVPNDWVALSLVDYQRLLLAQTEGLVTPGVEGERAVMKNSIAKTLLVVVDEVPHRWGDSISIIVKRTTNISDDEQYFNEMTARFKQFHPLVDNVKKMNIVGRDSAYPCVFFQYGNFVNRTNFISCVVRYRDKTVVTAAQYTNSFDWLNNSRENKLMEMLASLQISQ